jgi:pyruvate,orthophosphate dikinase
MNKSTATSTQWVYFFGGGSADGGADLKNLLGGKGANVAEMARLGIPVPPGFTLTTEVCTHFMRKNGEYPEGLREAVDASLSRLEKMTGKRFGDAKNPLLLSVRSRLDAGHDGHGVEPRPQRRDGARPGDALQ